MWNSDLGDEGALTERTEANVGVISQSYLRISISSLSILSQESAAFPPLPQERISRAPWQRRKKSSSPLRRPIRPHTHLPPPTSRSASAFFSRLPRPV